MVSPTHLSKEEVARLGEEIYEKNIRAQVEAQNDGKILAIDVITGDYEIDDKTLPAADRLRARHPSAILYVIRIGYDAVTSFGGLLPRQTKS
jgi:hypothetical protein